MIFVKEDILSKHLIKHNFPRNIEGFFVEFDFRKSKWLLFATYITMILFYSQEILMQKIMNPVRVLYFTNMISINKY